MNNDPTQRTTQRTEADARNYETPRLVDYGRLHSQTTGGTGHSAEDNPGGGGGDVFRK